MVQWTPEMEQILFSSICKNKPVGVHKHFRMVAIQKNFLDFLGLSISCDEVWKRLSKYYDLESLDQLSFEEEQPSAFKESLKDDDLVEFSLPAQEFESIIDEYRKSDTATEPSSAAQSPVAAKASTRKRAHRKLSQDIDNETSTSTQQEDAQRSGRKKKEEPPVSRPRGRPRTSNILPAAAQKKKKTKG